MPDIQPVELTVENQTFDKLTIGETKMADFGQITGGLLGGPLGFENAVSEVAAAEKGISSQVADKADILVVPDLFQTR